MSIWVGAAPAIGSGSLDGFAIGALMSGACFVAITAPRRVRKRQPAVARDGGTLAVERSGWLCEHVMAAEAVGADAERLAQPEELGAHCAGHSPADREGRTGGYQSRHRLGDPVPAGPPPGGVSPERAFPESAFPGGAVRDDASPDRAFPESAFPESAFPESAFPESAFPGGAPEDDALHHDPFPDVAFPNDTFGRWRPPDVRRPRHAAPTVSFAARMTGLWATRALASGARG